MRENYIVCNCKQVSYGDISDAVYNSKRFDDVLEAFKSVQNVTSLINDIYASRVYTAPSLVLD